MVGNITTYTSPEDKLQPSEEGITALRRAGEEEGAAGRQQGDYYRQAVDAAGGPIAKAIDEHNNFMEIGQVSAAGAVLSNNASQAWSKIANDPNNLNDDTIQKKFMDDTLEPQLQELQDAPNTEAGKEHALRVADDIRTNFWNSTSASMSHNASQAVLQNGLTIANQHTNMVVRDPASLPLAMQQTNAYYDAAIAQHANRLGEAGKGEIEKARTDALNNETKGALMGLADKNPEAALAALKNGTFMGVKLDDHLPGLEGEQMKQYAMAGRMARQLEAQQRRDAEIYKNQQANLDTAGKIFGSSTPPSSVELFSSQGFSPEQKKAFIGEKGILSLTPEQWNSTDFGPDYAQAASAIRSGMPLTADGVIAGVRNYAADVSKGITPAGANALYTLSQKAKTPAGAAELKAQEVVFGQMQKDYNL